MVSRLLYGLGVFSLCLFLSSCATTDPFMQDFVMQPGTVSPADNAPAPVSGDMFSPLSDAPLPGLADNPAATPDSHIHADQIVVYKSRRMLYLMRQGHILRKYRVALGKNPMGHKMEWGDFRTPEGRYIIDMKNAQSGYYRSLRISYPDISDADVAMALDVKPGDWIMIHGMPNGRGPSDMGHPMRDWTNGCIAVTNREMAEIWDLVQVGTPINIWP